MERGDYNESTRYESLSQGIRIELELNHKSFIID